MFAAIDRTSTFTFVQLHEKATRRIAADFLQELIRAVPYTIKKICRDSEREILSEKEKQEQLEQARIAAEKAKEQARLVEEESKEQARIENERRAELRKRTKISDTSKCSREDLMEEYSLTEDEYEKWHDTAVVQWFQKMAGNDSPNPDDMPISIPMEKPLFCKGEWKYKTLSLRIRLHMPYIPELVANE